MQRAYLVAAFYCLLLGCTTQEQRDQTTVGTLSHACETGIADRCVALANSYYLGWWTLETDPVQAAQLYRRACELASPEGCRRLGIYYEDGSAELIDLELARHFYNRACNLNDAVGCFRLAQIYEYSRVSPTDLQFAASLYLEACELYHTASCRKLGSFYEQGTAVMQSYVRAHFLYVISSDTLLGRTDAALERVSEQLTDEQIAFSWQLRRRCRDERVSACLRLAEASDD